MLRQILRLVGDSHLHELEIDGVRYGTDDGEGWGPPPRVSTGPGWETAPKRAFDASDVAHRLHLGRIVE